MRHMAAYARLTAAMSLLLLFLHCHTLRLRNIRCAAIRIRYDTLKSFERLAAAVSRANTLERDIDAAAATLHAITPWLIIS